MDLEGGIVDGPVTLHGPGRALTERYPWPIPGPINTKLAKTD
jgi:hypothetical protein